MIIEEYDESLFISRFEDYKRVVNDNWRGGNFTYKGLRYLFEYLDEAHDEENPLKLDVISLCCEFSEYKNIEEYLKDYSNIHEDLISDSETENFEKEDLNERLEEEISNKTTLIKFGDSLEDGFIIQQF